MKALMTRFRGMLDVMALVAVVAGGLAVTPAGAGAQVEGDAKLVGIVYDSTEMNVLAGARVAVIGTSAATDTDSEGRFVLEGIPAGTYWVSFFHPRLQALGVSPPSRQVSFGQGEAVRIEFAVPSEETLLMAWCLAEQPNSGFGAVAGLVIDSLTGVPMPSAIVTATPTRRTLGSPAPVEVRTNDEGYFRMCYVPSGTEMKVQAHFGRSSGRSVNMTFQPGTAVLQDLILLLSSEGTLTGRVRDYVTGDPVPGAEVTVIGTLSGALTDEKGRFTLDDLPPGRHLVTTDHLAYEARTDSVTIFSEEIVEIEVNLATEALEIEGMVVTARTRFGVRSLVGDSKRADFITREQIEPLLVRVTNTADLIRYINVPGLKIRDVYVTDQFTGVSTPSICIEVSRRSGGQGCRPAAVVINNVVIPYPDEMLRDLDPNIIDRIEVLTPVDAVFRYGQAAGNGAVVIYTR